MNALFQRMRHHATGMRDRGSPHSTVTPEAADTESVMRVLYREDRKPEGGRAGSDIIHASSFCHTPKCARFIVLSKAMREAGVTFTEPIFGSMKLVWSYGRAAEKHVRDTLLRDEGMRARAYGMWRCMCRQTFTRGHLPAAPARCPHCGTKADRYGEVTLDDPKHNISGNPDLILRELNSSAYAVWEIKSMKPDTKGEHQGFKDLKAPLPLHVEQGAHYVRLARLEGLPVIRKPVVLYVAKQFCRDNWYKPLIPSDPLMAQAEADVTTALDAAKGAVEGLRLGVIPDRLPKCAADRTCMSKKCQTWAECMAHD